MFAQANGILERERRRSACHEPRQVGPHSLDLHMPAISIMTAWCRLRSEFFYLQLFYLSPQALWAFVSFLSHV
jgi:hypothetical protein